MGLVGYTVVVDRYDIDYHPILHMADLDTLAITEPLTEPLTLKVADEPLHLFRIYPSDIGDASDVIIVVAKTWSAALHAYENYEEQENDDGFTFHYIVTFVDACGDIHIVVEKDWHTQYAMEASVILYHVDDLGAVRDGGVYRRKIGLTR